MDEKIKALVIGVGGNVSIAIVKALRDSGIATIHIFGACVQICNRLCSCDNRRFA